MVERQAGNLDEAETLSREALERSTSKRGDYWAMPYKVTGLAAVATDRADWDRAATLVGAAEAMMDREGAEWPPDERPHYERMLSAASSSSRRARVRTVRAIGRAMSNDQAVAFALASPAAG